MSVPPGTALLDVTALRKHFGGVRVVDDISLRVRAGETVAIIGPNGSGKTTTLRMIAGELRPDGGTVRLRGRSLDRLSVARRAELGIARTFQNGRVFGNLTVGENVIAGAFGRLRAARPLRRLRGHALMGWIPLLAELGIAVLRPGSVSSEARTLAAQARSELDRFALRLLPRIDERAFTLSYANRRRVEIARALAARPALLLLDEPAAGMNPAETDELRAQLAELRAAGQAMLLVEHKLDLVRALADRVIVLDAGAKIFDGSAADFQTAPAVLEAYIGRPGRSGTALLGTPAPPAPRTLLALRNIDAAYGSFKALSDVSLQVATGELVSLLGGNASGKSTTMKIVLGLLAPARGHVLLDERDITRERTADRIRLGVASVPEARRIFPALTVNENLALGAFAHGSPSAEDRERVFALFPVLAARCSQLGGTLSGGEQQMLAIGRALMSRPRLLCLDEPTMGLAPLFVERVLEALVAINAAGTSILMIEQNVGLALQIAHRGYVLASGAIVASGPAADLRDADVVRDAYLGSVPRAAQ